MKPERPPLPAPSIPLAVHLRWQAFRLLEKFSAPAAHMNEVPTDSPKAALWVFVSTIGELNAIGPFLRQLVDQHSQLQLVLLTDRSIYREAYLAQYPAAEVIEIGVSSAPSIQLAAHRPPQLFIVAEIPCLPADAPCRLPFGYLYQARRAGARITLVNGWLYGYAPSCRMDSIERQLLGTSYLQLFDTLCVQTEDVARQLIAAGAQAERVHVTGNIKFDALQNTERPWQDTRSPQTLHSLEQGTRHIIVAGCVTDDSERELVLDAFAALRQQQADALLVLAPRHPENPDVMRELHATLQARQLNYRCRSSDGDAAIANELAVLVLDTMGELRDFYARASVTHVGRDHNVLEPLAFGKPVTVRPDWDKTYPSYPVFGICVEHSLLAICQHASALAEAWRDLGAGSALPGDAPGIQSARGATQRCLQRIGATPMTQH